MRRILLAAIIPLLITPFGYCKAQPLQITIKSDKEVYEVGEDIVIHAGLKNISDKVVNVNAGGYLDWNDACRFFFKNVKGEVCRLIHMGPVDITIPDQLPSKQLCDFWSYTIGLLRDKEFKWQEFKFELVKGKDYSFTGKQTIYMKYYGLTSNIITIEVVEKEKNDLPPHLSFLSDIPGFQEFRFQMTESEIREIVQRNSLILEGNSQDGFIITNKGGETLALSMADGRCSGIRRLRKLQPLQWFDKSSPLKLTIKSEKQIYKTGEEIKIEMNIKNASDKPVIISEEFMGLDVKDKSDGINFIFPYFQAQASSRILGELKIFKLPAGRDYTKVFHFDNWEINIQEKTYNIGTAYKIHEFPNRYTIKGVYNCSVNRLKGYSNIKEDQYKDILQGEFISQSITIKIEGREPMLTTDKEYYDQGDKIILTLTNYLDQDICYFYTCAFSLCEYQKEEWVCQEKECWGKGSTLGPGDSRQIDADVVNFTGTRFKYKFGYRLGMHAEDPVLSIFSNEFKIRE
ncbi:MAG: hypothetical protein MUO85_01510 [candidate division Zixibacteria bacterium]|nr:hypothetical protein [candidate division Zixibacteria bacterium]